MDVFEAVRTRRSIRVYEDREVEKEKLMKVLEAARLSPSANNNQPWHFVLVTDAATRQTLYPAYIRDWFAKAPAIIVACAQPKKAWARQDGEDYWKVDVAIAMQNMMLTAHELDLGTCWIAAFDEAKVKEALKIPDDTRVIAMMPLGYPAESKAPVSDRKSLEEIVHFQRW